MRYEHHVFFSFSPFNFVSISYFHSRFSVFEKIFFLSLLLMDFITFGYRSFFRASILWFSFFLVLFSWSLWIIWMIWIISLSLLRLSYYILFIILIISSSLFCIILIISSVLFGRLRGKNCNN